MCGTAAGTSACNDAIILGGTTTTIGGGTNDAFQGYGTYIAQNYFDQIRVNVLMRAYANGVQVYNNTTSKTCGSSQAGGMGAAYYVQGPDGRGNTFVANLVEDTNYAYGFYGGPENVFVGNSTWDSGAGTIAYHIPGSVLIPANADEGIAHLYDGASNNSIILAPYVHSGNIFYNYLDSLNIHYLMSVHIRTGTTANTDVAGQLTLASGTATYTFNDTYTNAPICTASDVTAANPVQVSTTPTALTAIGTGTDVINYICIGRN